MGKNTTRVDPEKKLGEAGAALSSTKDRKVEAHVDGVDLSATPKSNPTKGIQILKDLASETPLDLIRLIVEGRLLKLESGCYKYESRDPGCIQQMAKGLSVVMEDLEEKGRHNVDVEWLKDLHKLAIGEKFTMNYGGAKEHESGQINGRHIGYKFVAQKIFTTKGLEELYDLQGKNMIIL